MKKICSTCKKEYPATPEYFYRTKNIKCGLVAQCKECKKEIYGSYYKKYRERNREWIREYMREWSRKKKKENIAEWRRARNRSDKAYLNNKRFGGNWFKTLERDNYTCQECGVKEPKQKDGIQRVLIVHHIDFVGRGHEDEANNDIDNLITYCKSCHMKIHWQHRKVGISA